MKSVRPQKYDKNIHGGVLKLGVPLVIIHIYIYIIQLLGYPIDGKPHSCFSYSKGLESEYIPMALSPLELILEYSMGISWNSSEIIYIHTIPWYSNVTTVTSSVKILTVVLL